MRGFIILCLVALACGDKLGYNYHPVGHSDSGLSFGPGGSSFAGDVGGGQFGGGSDLGGGLEGGASYNAPVQEELSKEFYTFTAPEEEFDDAQGAQQLSGSLKKNIRVIFIKGPENNGLERAALNLAKHVSEQKTAIYVLHKQTDLGDLADKFQQQHSHVNARPEVHFVKYRTPQDAANAQRTIQSQYDALGGSSQSHDGGVAPVINFASAAPARSQYRSGGGIGGGIGGGVGGGHIQAPSSNYLPASLLRTIRY